ncbi:unnamed protein product [Lymnaea stagnalis]|uniref:Caffeoyl-CoA O-methyltransferase n=1 Tax=Lymnaea stagnalis TaxID=6523 RepID=A0AAV2HK26_LYMST
MSDSQHILSYYDPAVEKVEKALKLAQSTKASPEVIRALQSACQLIQQREQFTKSSTSEASDACKNILSETNKHDWAAAHQQGKTSWYLMPLMMSGPTEGSQFLKSIVSIQKAKRILEIGMFTGYSALSMAEALPADGEMVTIDQDEYLKRLVEDKLFKRSPHHRKIKCVIGKAPEIVKRMAERGEQFDIIFLDADQANYLEYFKYAFEKNLLGPGGSVLIDNAFMQGDGYMSTTGENNTKRFAHWLASNLDLHKVLVPLRDGVLMVRRLSDVEGAIS